MCGIFGSFSHNKIKINKNILVHRGPDDWGVDYYNYNNKWVTLFQSRLSIIGLGSQGHQPFNKNQNFSLCYNGEIYNYKKLKKSIQKLKNIKFNTETDTELLYEYLICFGIEKTLNDIDGIFAFSFYNHINGEIYLVRDPLGVKPLYYFNSNGKLYFSSEAKVFFEMNLVTPKINKDLLGEYFANAWIYEPDTLFKGIKKVQAGHYLEINLNNELVINKKYWDITNYSNSKIPKLEKIIDNQTLADVPVGVYFSGGIDSSIIAYQLKEKNLIYLNLNLNDTESERVKDFERLYGVKVNKIKYEKDNLELYNKLVYFMDEPIADPAIIPAYLLAKEAKSLGCTVMLSGMGGDEIDAGYTRHKILINPFIYRILSYLPSFSIFKGKLGRDIDRLKNFFSTPQPSNYYSLTSYFSNNEINELVGKNWLSSYKNKIDNMVEGLDDLLKFFYLDFKGFLASHNLIYMDKASMSASVEVRVPLMQKDLVNHYFNNIVRKNKREQKHRLKSILKNQMNNNYTEIQKQGFRYPIEDWIKNDINWLKIIQFFDENNIINTKLVSKWVNISRYDTKSVSMKLWGVYTLYQWLKSYSFKWDD